MRKLLTKLKDASGTISRTRSSPSSQGSVEHYVEQPFPAEIDFYRHRKQRGVNLGSWFVLERWIAESPFRSAKAPAQSDLDVAAGPDAKAVLEQHWDNWITERDWRWMAEHGINTVRIPIGYYHTCGADPSVLGDTDFADLHGIFVGAWARITNALETAYHHGIGVLFDLHAAPGKQNSDAHSGTSAEPLFFKNKRHMTHTITVLSIFATHITVFARRHNPPLPNLVGIELLNEPGPGPHHDALKKWYLDAFRAIRKIDPHLPIYIGDCWQTEQYATFVKDSGTPFVALDHHLYRCFTPSDISTSVNEHTRRLNDPNEQTPQLFARISRELETTAGALVVGEWSAALNPGSLQSTSDEWAAKAEYVRAQLRLYEEHCAGWFFWTYKKESAGDTGWAFRDAVDADVFPSPAEFRRVRGRARVSFDESGDVKKARTRDEALENHKSYWDQYPGQYEHWRFCDGFSTGWDDAVQFDTWTSAGTSPYAEELGFKGPWSKHRTDEHIRKKGDGGHVWEFQHGFTQGLKAAKEYIYSI